MSFLREGWEALPAYHMCLNRYHRSHQWIGSSLIGQVPLTRRVFTVVHYGEIDNVVAHNQISEHSPTELLSLCWLSHFAREKKGLTGWHQRRLILCMISLCRIINSALGVLPVIGPIIWAREFQYVQDQHTQILIYQLWINKFCVLKDHAYPPSKLSTPGLQSCFHQLQAHSVWSKSHWFQKSFWVRLRLLENYSTQVC